MIRIKKYQRISSIVAEVLSYSAIYLPCGRDPDFERARVTAIWSPAGGVGKTAVALAYAAKVVSEGKQALYLDLEPFSSVPVYFNETGRSISAIFEMLENGEGNVKMLIRSTSQQDFGGIKYFCKPDNYDDINILSAENIEKLTNACAGVTDELVIDMSCVCDERARRVFSLADKVFLVVDQSAASQIKMNQFASQHSDFLQIKDKVTLVANKGAAINVPFVETIVSLPFVKSTDRLEVYQTMSAGF